jgi:hypothetical protein
VTQTKQPPINPERFNKPQAPLIFIFVELPFAHHSGRDPMWPSAPRTAASSFTLLPVADYRLQAAAALRAQMTESPSTAKATTTVKASVLGSNHDCEPAPIAQASRVATMQKVNRSVEAPALASTLAGGATAASPHRLADGGASERAGPSFGPSSTSFAKETC